MTTLIKQRESFDCGIACLAMALNLSWDDVMQSMPEQHVDELKRLGMSDSMYKDLFAALGLVNDVDYTVRYYGHHWCNYRFFKNMLWGRRAICQVRSKNYAEGFHFVYWNGHAVYDPSTKETYSTDEWPNEIEPGKVWMFNETERPAV